MQDELISLFQYLEKEEISIDKKEFHFQLQSHPDYPSLMSIVDTFDFFNIENGALNVNSSEIELLPEQFIAYLNDEEGATKLHYIENKGGSYTEIKNKKVTVISKDEIIKRWKGVVLLVEKSESNPVIPKNIKSSLFALSLLVVFILVLFQLKDATFIKLFFVFPVLGLLFSVAALKDLFDTKNELINSFCGKSINESCSKMVDSNKWEIFKYVNFSDLSIILFSSQFLSLLIFMMAEKTISFFIIQEILFFGALPILMLSIYYQKFVEKKWCRICLSISSIIIAEFIYVMFLPLNINEISLKPIIFFSLVFTTSVVSWHHLKKILEQQKDLKEFQFKGKRFIKNYEIFKNTLIVTEPILDEISESHKIIIGNRKSSTKITIISSPFCGHCQEVHSIMGEILEKHQDKVQFDIRFNFNSELSDERSKKIHYQLISIYLKNGSEAFSSALKDWFENKDETKLDSGTISEEMDLIIADLLEEQFKSNQQNNFNFTPVILVNRYVYPKQYERSDLIYFINELSDDEYFIDEKNSFN